MRRKPFGYGECKCSQMTVGELTSYRYGSKGKNVDWQVYCIALEQESELLKILNKL